jgi:hypothetical protein
MPACAAIFVKTTVAFCCHAELTFVKAPAMMQTAITPKSLTRI